MKDFFLILSGALSGGFCAAIGGCIAIWYQAKKARQIRMEEVIGEQRLEACKKALSLIGQIQVRLIAETTGKVLNFLCDNVEWFSMNQILLPHKFVENWKSIMANLRHLKLIEESLNKKIPDGLKQQETVKELSGLNDFIRNLSEEAEKALRKELKVPDVKIKSWKKPSSL